MHRSPLRPLAGLLLAALLALPALALPGAAAADEPTPAPAGRALPNNAGLGERISVYLSGWAPGTQLQAALCGDNAIGGSRACHLPSAVTGTTDPEGALTLQLVLDRPPRPCPCVVHVAPFSGQGTPIDIPVNVVGVRIGTPPAPTVTEPAALRLEGLRVEGGASLLRAFGLGGDARLVLTVANDGGEAGALPGLRYGFGAAAAASTLTDPGIVVPAGESREVVLEAPVPVAAIGAQRASVGWGDGSGLLVDAELTTYPWATLALLVSVPCAAWLITRARRRAAAAAPPAAPTPSAYPLPDVVYVEGLGGLLVNPDSLRTSRTLRRVAGRVTGDDLARLAAGGRVDRSP
ncbi:hypothetical protein E8D34_04885 [Nocardioides sp. GY 10113]|uniref:hypothetical protein n=1 Tax=Nocardioides sp. GY 10113 TaxID=2569761 RepID=UPI0010A793C2|nr:hypothetical protein [Nocardioides sp. GY 10113]TIC88279.1 hypothetical protein E8D34_04885 [Nocardioides sp. GY 10113]